MQVSTLSRVRRQRLSHDAQRFEVRLVRRRHAPALHVRVALHQHRCSSLNCGVLPRHAVLCARAEEELRLFVVQLQSQLIVADRRRRRAAPPAHGGRAARGGWCASGRRAAQRNSDRAAAAESAWCALRARCGGRLRGSFERQSRRRLPRVPATAVASARALRRHRPGVRAERADETFDKYIHHWVASNALGAGAGDGRGRLRAGRPPFRRARVCRR